MSSRRWYAMLLAAVLLITLSAVAELVIDGNILRAERRHAQNVADGAAWLPQWT
jgi:uncharacterized membrane protein